MSAVECFALTQAGVGKARNEDRVTICDTALDAGEDWLQTSLACCAAVFDGVSQGGRGSEASSCAAEALARHARCDAALFDDETCAERVGSLFDDVQATLLRKAAHEGPGVGPMSTASGVVITQTRRVVGFNVGDSRVYRLRAGMLLQLSEDHSVVRELFVHGASDELLAEARRTQSHVITRALGIPATSGHVVDVENYGQAQPGDLFLGCTDGIHDSVPRADLKAALGRHATGATLREIGHTLLEQALIGGSTDDLTLFLLRVSREEDSLRPTGGTDDGR